MASKIIYLDESGDLGWSFDKPYRRGGSSRHLTISSLFVSSEIKHLPKRLIRNLYRKFRWDPKEEKKWSDMTVTEREFFASKAQKLLVDNLGEISYHSIIVRKERVQHHIRTDPNKLYNYMIGLSLLDEMSKHQEILFIPDPRAIKVESGNSLHDYLLTSLWFEKKVSTSLITTPISSDQCTNLQFADMLSGLVQHHFEDGNSHAWDILKDHIQYKKLFFC